MQNETTQAIVLKSFQQKDQFGIVVVDGTGSYPFVGSCGRASRVERRIFGTPHVPFHRLRTSGQTVSAAHHSFSSHPIQILKTSNSDGGPTPIAIAWVRGTVSLFFRGALSSSKLVEEVTVSF